MDVVESEPWQFSPSRATENIEINEYSHSSLGSISSEQLTWSPICVFLDCEVQPWEKPTYADKERTISYDTNQLINKIYTDRSVLRMIFFLSISSLTQKKQSIVSTNYSLPLHQTPRTKISDLISQHSEDVAPLLPLFVSKNVLFSDLLLQVSGLFA